MGKKTFTIEGDLDFSGLLHDLGKVSGTDVADAIHEALEPIARDASAKAPRRSGKLAESIEVEITEVSKTGATGEVGSNEVHAGFVELGTSKTPAQPYLRPAIDANEKKSMRIFMGRLNKSLDKRGR